MTLPHLYYSERRKRDTTEAPVCDTSQITQCLKTLGDPLLQAMCDGNDEGLCSA